MGRGDALILVNASNRCHAHFPALDPGQTLAVGRDGDLADV